MAEPGEVLVSVTGVVKDYRALRPLRIQAFELRAGERVALLGLDQAAAEVLVNLISGATLPDAGTVVTFGRSTAAITDGATWLQSLDDFGILSERAVLLEGLSVEQNLAVPLSLDLYDLPTDIRARASALATEVGLGADDLLKATATLPPSAGVRLRLGRAIAVNPRVLMAEHPNAVLSPEERGAFADTLVRIADRRRLALLVLTADRDFATATGQRVLKLNAATGELTDAAVGWRKWFG